MNEDNIALIEAIRWHRKYDHKLISLYSWDSTKTKFPGKQPLKYDWLNDDESHASILRSVGKGRNVGWVPGENEFVIDVDPRNGGDESFAKLEEVVGQIIGPCVMTGGGGFHIYLSKPGDVSILAKHPSYPGIDFISQTRHVVIAGSIHPSGDAYYWENDKTPGALSDVSEKLLKLVRKTTKAVKPEHLSEERTYTRRQVKELLKFIPNDSDDVDYDTWLCVGMAIHFETGGSTRGFDIWDEWSSATTKDRVKDNWETWQSFKDDGGITGEYLRRHAGKQGYEFRHIDYEKDMVKLEQLERAEHTQGSEEKNIEYIDNGVKVKAVKWCWKNFIARGQTHLIAGEPGAGKSLVIMDIIAKLTTGSPFPHEDIALHKPMKVLYVGTEDTMEEVFLPRAIVSGVDRSRLHRIGFMSDKKHGKAVINLDQHGDKLYKLVEEGGYGCVVIDPIANHLSSESEFDMNSQTSVTRIIAPLNKMAETLGVVVLMVAHSNKSSSGLINSVMGSKGFISAPRIVMGLMKSREHEEQKVLGTIMTNLGNSREMMTLEVVARELNDWEGNPITTAGVSWVDKLEGDFEDAVGKGRPGGNGANKKTKFDDVYDWIRRNMPIDQEFESGDLADRIMSHCNCSRGSYDRIVAKLVSDGILVKTKHAQHWYTKHIDPLSDVEDLQC